MLFYQNRCIFRKNRESDVGRYYTYLSDPIIISRVPTVVRFGPNLGLVKWQILIQLPHNCFKNHAQCCIFNKVVDGCGMRVGE